MYYSIYDRQTGRTMATGRNSKSQIEAANAGIDYILSDNLTSKKDENSIRKANEKEKISFLSLNDMIIEEHEIKNPENI